MDGITFTSIELKISKNLRAIFTDFKSFFNLPELEINLQSFLLSYKIFVITC